MKLRYFKNVVTLELDQGGCIGCGRCLEVCPHQVFTLEDKRAKISNRDACMECGACAKNCPPQVIQVRPGVGCAWAIITTQEGEELSCCGSQNDCC